MTAHLIAALQQIGLECACCRQIYHPHKAFDDSVEAALFGTDAYVACAVCEMNVPVEMQDAGYKKRWRRAMRLHLRRDLRKDDYTLLSALSILANHPATPETDKLFDAILREVQSRFPEKTWPVLKNAGDKLWKFMSQE